jgi:hypothetical protein
MPGGVVRFLNQASGKPAVMDYSAALASAVAWLGNRYLLARPAKRLTDFERCDIEEGVSTSRPLRFRELVNHGDDACQNRPTHP